MMRITGIKEKTMKMYANDLMDLYVILDGLLDLTATPTPQQIGRLQGLAMVQRAMIRLRIEQVCPGVEIAPVSRAEA